MKVKVQVQIREMSKNTSVSNRDRVRVRESNHKPKKFVSRFEKKALELQNKITTFITPPSSRSG